jgi:hypothetical protein
MGRRIQPARGPGTGVPTVQSVEYTTGQTFKRGALVVFTAAGQVSECAATPTEVSGVALENAGSKPGYDAANSPSPVTGRVQEVSIALADRLTVYSMRGVNGATDPSTPAQTNLNETYQVLKTGNDWVLDLATTANAVFEVVDIDIPNKIFFCKFVEARISLP